MPGLADLDLLARLVGFRTCSSHREPTVPLGDFLVDYLDHPLIRATRLDCGEGRENLWFECGPDPTPGGPGLLLCGHVDVVPADEPEWLADPFELRVTGDRAIGRGACDMKGFDALAVNLLRRVAERGAPETPVCLLLTCDEEIGTVGAGLFADAWRGRGIPARTVIGEPTSLRPVLGHKGHLSLTVAVGGRACHTGFPDRGVNAIEEAIPVLETLRDLRRVLVEERAESSDLFPETPYAVLTIACAIAANAINVMPERLELRVGVRLLPGQTGREFLSRLEAGIVSAGLRLAEADPLEPGSCRITVNNETPAYAIERSDPWLKDVLDLVDPGADPAALGGVNYGTDAGRLVPLGCRSVIFGPGDISVAHRPEEWLSLEEFERAGVLLSRLC